MEYKSCWFSRAIYCKYKNDCERKHTVIDMHPFSQDALLILKKENEEVCEDVW